jgi:hypothetical protein
MWPNVGLAISSDRTVQLHKIMTHCVLFECYHTLYQYWHKDIMHTHRH